MNKAMYFKDLDKNLQDKLKNDVLSSTRLEDNTPLDEIVDELTYDYIFMKESYEEEIERLKEELPSYYRNNQENYIFGIR